MIINIINCSNVLINESHRKLIKIMLECFHLKNIIDNNTIVKTDVIRMIDLYHYNDDCNNFHDFLYNINDSFLKIQGKMDITKENKEKYYDFLRYCTVIANNFQLNQNLLDTMEIIINDHYDILEKELTNNLKNIKEIYENIELYNINSIIQFFKENFINHKESINSQ